MSTQELINKVENAFPHYTLIRGGITPAVGLRGQPIGGINYQNRYFRFRKNYFSKKAKCHFKEYRCQSQVCHSCNINCESSIKKIKNCEVYFFGRKGHTCNNNNHSCPRRPVVQPQLDRRERRNRCPIRIHENAIEIFQPSQGHYESRVFRVQIRLPHGVLDSCTLTLFVSIPNEDGSERRCRSREAMDMNGWNTKDYLVSLPGGVEYGDVRQIKFQLVFSQGLYLGNLSDPAIGITKNYRFQVPRVQPFPVVFIPRSEIVDILPSRGPIEGDTRCVVYVYFERDFVFNAYLRRMKKMGFTVTFGGRTATRLEGVYHGTRRITEDTPEIPVIVLDTIVPRGTTPGPVDVHVNIQSMGSSSIIERRGGYTYLSKKREKPDQSFDQPAFEEEEVEEQMLLVRPISPIGESPNFGNNDLLFGEDGDVFGGGQFFCDIAEGKLSWVRRALTMNPSLMEKMDIYGYCPLDVAMFFRRKKIHALLAEEYEKRKERMKKLEKPFCQNLWMDEIVNAASLVLSTEHRIVPGIVYKGTECLTLEYFGRSDDICCAADQHNQIMYVLVNGGVRSASDLVKNLVYYDDEDKSKGRVHKGYKEKANSFPLAPFFSKLSEEWKVVFTGYSAAASVACLWCLRLLVRAKDSNIFNNAEEKYSDCIKYVGFGSPMVGDGDFVSYLERKGFAKCFHNIVSENDIVPLITSRFGEFSAGKSEEYQFQKKIAEAIFGVSFGRGKDAIKNLEVSSDGSIRNGLGMGYDTKTFDTDKMLVRPFGEYWFVGERGDLRLNTSNESVRVIEKLRGDYSITNLHRHGFGKYFYSIFSGRECALFEKSRGGKFSQWIVNKYNFALKISGGGVGGIVCGVLGGVYGTVAGSFSGMVTGALLGSVVPIVGTSIGAVVGVISGGTALGLTGASAGAVIGASYGAYGVSGLEKRPIRLDEMVGSEMELDFRCASISELFRYREKLRATFNDRENMVRVSIEGENLELVKNVSVQHAVNWNKKKKSVRGVRKEIRGNNVIILRYAAGGSPGKTLSVCIEDIWKEKPPENRRWKIEGMRNNKKTIDSIPIFERSLSSQLIFVLLQSSLLQYLMFSDSNSSKFLNYTNSIRDALLRIEDLDNEGLKIKSLEYERERNKTIDVDELREYYEASASICAILIENGLEMLPEYFLLMSGDPLDFIDKEKYADMPINNSVKKKIRRSMGDFVCGSPREIGGEETEDRQGKCLSFVDLFKDWEKEKDVMKFFCMGLKTIFKISLIQSSVNFKAKEEDGHQTEKKGGFLERMLRFVVESISKIFSNSIPLYTIEGDYVRKLEVFSEICGAETVDTEISELEQKLVDRLVSEKEKKSILSKSTEESSPSPSFENVFEHIKFTDGWSRLSPKDYNKEDKESIEVFYKFLVRIHELRKIVGQVSMLLVVGSQKVGKSSTFKDIWNLQTESFDMVKKGSFNTRNPKLYFLSEKPEFPLVVVDSPAVNDKDPMVRCVLRILPFLSSCVLLITTLQNCNSEQEIGLMNEIQDRMEIPTHIIFNKTDVVYSNCFSKAQDNFYENIYQEDEENEGESEEEEEEGEEDEEVSKEEMKEEALNVFKARVKTLLKEVYERVPRIRKEYLDLVILEEGTRFLDEKNDRRGIFEEIIKDGTIIAGNKAIGDVENVRSIIKELVFRTILKKDDKVLGVVEKAMEKKKILRKRRRRKK